MSTYPPGRSAAVCSSLISILLANPDSHANLIVNGDFEDPFVTNPIGWNVYYAGQSFPGWTVGEGSVDIVRIVVPGFGDAFSGASGLQSVDLNGFSPGSIYQDIPTSAGTAYYLSFAMAGNVVGGPLIVHMDFLWQGGVIDTLTFDVGNHDGYNMGWTYYQYQLIAPASAGVTRLKFESLSNTGSRGPALDDVVLGLAPRSGIPIVNLPNGDPHHVPDTGSTAAMSLMALLGIASSRLLHSSSGPTMPARVRDFRPRSSSERFP